MHNASNINILRNQVTGVCSDFMQHAVHHVEINISSLQMFVMGKKDNSLQMELSFHDHRVNIFIDTSS